MLHKSRAFSPHQLFMRTTSPSHDERPEVEVKHMQFTRGSTIGGQQDAQAWQLRICLHFRITEVFDIVGASDRLSQMGSTTSEWPGPSYLLKFNELASKGNAREHTLRKGG
jgi:hypothetical protein